MASETSELTFVRCPSCRSLVPASAARCRICNNPLEGGGKGGKAEGSQGSGRVRQKTITATADEVRSAEALAADSDQSPAATPQSVESQVEADPLGAYMQELDDDMASTPVPIARDTTQPANGDDDLDAFLRELDDLGGPADDITAQEAHGNPQSNSPNVDPTEPIDDFTAVLEEEVAFEPKPEVVAVTPPPRAIERPAPTPRHEPPSAPPPKKTAPPQPSKPQPPMQRLERGGRDLKAHQSGSHEHERRESRDHGRNDSHRQGRRHEDGRHGGRDERRSETRPQAEPPQTSAIVAGPKTGKMRPGRLFGWLVSFESADGRAIELREGKFFVTGSNIRPSDLVIEDPSISTPHALMVATRERGLVVQDLMSDRGLFVRHGERGQYQKEDGPVEVKHGDWLRFGDVEFLVTLVPG